MTVQDINAYTKMFESLNMLKVIAMSKEQIEKGRFVFSESVFEKIEKKLGCCS